MARRSFPLLLAAIALAGAFPAAASTVEDQVTVSLTVSSTSTPTSTPAEQPSGGGGAPLPGAPLVVSDVSITYLSPDEVLISWLTNLPATTMLRYGRTLQYEEATVAYTELYTLRHEVSLTGLQPGSLYHGQIVGATASGQQVVSSDFVFSTEEEADRTPPANVGQLLVNPGDGRITLSWQNPTDRDFAGVAVVRSTAGFPGSVGDGDVVARTAGTSLADAGLTNGRRYYYALFTYDSTLNYSSGAIGSGVPQAAPAPGQPQLPPPPQPMIPPDYVPVPPAQSLPPSAVQVAAYLGSVVLPASATGTVNVVAGESFTIILPSFQLQRSVRQVLVEPQTPEGIQWYLMRVEPGQSSYRATLPAILAPGAYVARVHILYADHTQDTISKTIVVHARGQVVGTDSRPLPEAVVVLWVRRGTSWQLWQPVEYARNPVVTGEDGSFGFMVDGGRYRVQVLKGGYEPWDEEVEARGGIVAPTVTLRRASGGLSGGYAGAATNYVLVALALLVLVLTAKLVRKR